MKKNSGGNTESFTPRTVLIHTRRDDVHAKIVDRALTERGNKVISWEESDYPSRAVMSFSYRDGSTSATYRNGDFEFSASDIDVVWNRRRPGPVVPKIVGVEQRTFVREELKMCVASSDHLIDHAFWINKPYSAAYSELKPIELKLAQKNGLRIPATLISNDRKMINDFLKTHESCIYKSLTGLNEETDAGKGKDAKVRMLFTADIDKSMLPRGKILQAAPGIFQEKIGKRFEVRVQFFGKHYAAIAIDSHSLREGHLDWRIGQASIKSCKPISLPGHIYEACLGLMKDFDIVSSAFDFIVDNNENWIFLEINEAGQFLFIEHWCPELFLLDAFCQFIECADPDFQYTPVKNPVHFEQFRQLALPDA
jgi:hypothetical protein